MKPVLFEIVATCVIFLLISAGSFWFLHPLYNAYYFAKSDYQATLSLLKERQQTVQSNKKIETQLLQWQTKNPALFSAVQENKMDDQETQALTDLIQQSGFRILQANLLRFIVSGHYADLFDLLHRINQSPWPITLSSVQINGPSQFTIVFTMENKAHD